MKTKTAILILTIASSIALFSCDNASKRMDDATYTSEGMDISMNNPFTLTLDDLKTEKLEVEKELTKLKNAHQERKAHDYEKFRPEIERMEVQLDSLDQIVNTFEGVEENEKAQVYDRFKVLKKEILENIADVEARFNDLKVLDT